jgi:4-aminobutyrate aminotransferase
MTWQAGHHGSTYGGNPISCAVALETIKLLEGGLIDNAAARGEQLRADLAPLLEQHPDLVRDVRGKGLMIGIEFDSGDIAEAVQWACLQRGLLVLEAGETVVRMSPPLVVTADECATAARIFGEAVAHVARDAQAAIIEARTGGAVDETHVGG